MKVGQQSMLDYENIGKQLCCSTPKFCPHHKSHTTRAAWL